jgi:hypothetical protein
VDSGATHNVLREPFAQKNGLLAHATPASRSITGFDGLRSQSGFKITLHLNYDPSPSHFIITTLKDACNGILRMPWIAKHGHCIDWIGRHFTDKQPDFAVAEANSLLPPKSPIGLLGEARMLDKGVCVLDTLASPQCKHNISPFIPHPEVAGKQASLLDFHQASLLRQRPPDPGEPIAAAETVSLQPTNTSVEGAESWRNARNCDEGVCVADALTLPQCESKRSHPTRIVVPAGKPLPSLGQAQPTQIKAAKALWSTSAQLAAKAQTAVQQQPVKTLVPKEYHRYLAMFKKKGSQALPPLRKYNFCVELMPGAVPQASRIIPLSPTEHNVLDTLIKDGLAHGTIQRTTSPWAAPVLITGKKDVDLRPCFDYRRLNAVTVKNKYPLPLTMDLVDSLLDADRFTKLDLRNTYGNLRVAEGNEEKLAFICHAGQFAPLTMPFGPTGAPGFFQYFIQDILLGRVGKDVAAYLDDIMIYTQRGSDHQAAVTSVLETLSKHHLWLKPKKCKFARSEVEYLGLLISCNRLRMDPAKVQAVTDWPSPQNVTELQRFIGFSNFY